MADVLASCLKGKTSGFVFSCCLCTIFRCAAKPEQQHFCLPLLRDMRAEEKLPGVRGALDAERTAGGRV